MNKGIERYVEFLHLEIDNCHPVYHVIDTYKGLLFINKYDPVNLEFIEYKMCKYLKSVFDKYEVRD